jgi:hypothetical protein
MVIIATPGLTGGAGTFASSKTRSDCLGGGSEGFPFLSLQLLQTLTARAGLGVAALPRSGASTQRARRRVAAPATRPGTT